MKITSFDNEKRKIEIDRYDDSIYDIFQKNIVNSSNIQVWSYIIPKEQEMRLDKISKHLYGSNDYVEELMVLNDIISPFSIKEGQSIYFCKLSDFDRMYIKDDIITSTDLTKKEQLMDSQTNTTSSNKGLPLTIMPDSLKQISINKDNKIKIINSFQ